MSTRQPPPSVLALIDEAVQRWLDAGGPYRARVCTEEVVAWLMAAGWVLSPDSREDLPTGTVLPFRDAPERITPDQGAANLRRLSNSLDSRKGTPR